MPYARTFFQEIVPYLSPEYTRLVLTIKSGWYLDMHAAMESTFSRSQVPSTITLDLFWRLIRAATLAMFTSHWSLSALRPATMISSFSSAVERRYVRR